MNRIFRKFFGLVAALGTSGLIFAATIA